MADNWLMFNDSNTEIMILISRFSPIVDCISLHTEGEHVCITDTAGNLAHPQEAKGDHS